MASLAILGKLYSTSLPISIGWSLQGPLNPPPSCPWTSSLPTHKSVTGVRKITRLHVPCTSMCGCWNVTDAVFSDLGIHSHTWWGISRIRLKFKHKLLMSHKRFVQIAWRYYFTTIFFFLFACILTVVCVKSQLWNCLVVVSNRDSQKNLQRVWRNDSVLVMHLPHKHEHLGSDIQALH